MSEYLNKNPEIIGSTNPEIGTESAKFFGKLLSAYNLINSTGDKERAISTFYFIYSPEPTTAVILLCAQIVDMMISLSHNRDLVKIYKNVASLNRQTISIYNQIYSIETDRQVRTIDEISENLMQNSNISKLFFASKTFGYINSKFLTVHPADEELIEDFEVFLSLINNINELRVQKLLLDETVESSLKSHIYEMLNVDLDLKINEYLRLGDSLVQIQKLIQIAFMEYSGIRWRKKLLDEVSKNREKIRSYYNCLEEVNKSLKGARGAETILIRKLMREQCRSNKEQSI